MSLLNDNFYKTGTDIQDFYKNLEKINENTKFEKKSLNKIKLLSHQEINGNDFLIQLDPKKPFNKNKKSFSFRLTPFDRNSLIEKGYSEEEVNEAIDCGLFMGDIKHLDQIVPFSDLALKSLAVRSKINGINFYKKSLSRDLSIAENFNSNEKCSIVKREEDGLSKIFAIMSNDYSPISQNLILKMIKEIEESFNDCGPMIPYNWIISHNITQIMFIFPDMKENFSKFYEIENMIPGIMIETSDIGNMSFKMKGFFIVDNKHISYMNEEVSQIHAGTINEEALIDSASKKIFPQYSYYPERLADLMLIDITKPEMTENEKRNQIYEFCKDISKFTGINKVLGKNRVKLLNEYLTDTFSIEAINSANKDNCEITAYDIAELFLTLPAHIENVNDYVKKQLSEVSIKVFDYDFNDKLKDFYIV